MTLQPICVGAGLPAKKKRAAPPSAEVQPAKRPFVAAATTASFMSTEDREAAQEFERRNEVAARKLLHALNSGGRLWAAHEWFYSGVSHPLLRRGGGVVARARICL